jgi:hypothetical protein
MDVEPQAAGSALTEESGSNGSDTIVIGPSEHSLIAAGRGAQVIYHQAITRVDEARAQARFEQEQLAAAVARLAQALNVQATTPPPAAGSLYKDLLPYDLSDAGRFFGRNELVDELIKRLACSDTRCRLVVLSGEAGLGKTSLLQAGLQPALLAAQHLPLLVRVSGASLAESIKRSLLGDLNRTPGLRDAPLQQFLVEAAGLLPEGRRLFVLLDQFEIFLEAPPEARQPFVDELAACLAAPDPGAHWLLSLRSSHQARLSSFQPAVPQPFANLVVLPGLSGPAARAAVLETASLRGLSLEDDLLDTLIADLGSESIDPTPLQLVCQALVAGLSPGDTRLTLSAYRQIGGAGQIARRYLEDALNGRIPPEDRRLAWNLLAAVTRSPGQSAGVKELQSALEIYPDLRRAETGRLLSLLENQRLVRQSEGRFCLTSDHFVPRVRQWEMEQAAREKARQETARQLQNLRKSALRGLIGGAAGFSLAYLLTFAPQVFERNLLGYLVVLRSVPGSLSGLIFVLFVDLALASYQGARRTGLWLAAGAAGAGAFALAVLSSSLLGSLPLLKLGPAALEGAIWGAAAGLGVAWSMTAGRPAWQTLSIVVLLCGLVLALLEPFGGAFGRPEQAWRVFAAGAVFPLLVATSAWLGRGSRWEPD